MGARHFLLLVVGIAFTAALSHGCPAPYRTFAGRWCLHVVVAQNASGYGNSLTWGEARSQCQGTGGDLVFLEDHTKAHAISKFIDEEYPSETTSGWTFFVGAHNVDGQWKWTNSRNANLLSNLWLPSHPQQSKAVSQLVPADKAHGRRNILSIDVTTNAPGYICERF